MPLPQPDSRFCRIDASKVAELSKMWKTHSYEPSNEYGMKASNKMMQTRGKGFRHEKTKRKRGGYRGGKLDFQIRSQKFDEATGSFI
mmetsp:Transcript_20313/g.38226  ORF Transcript_20313/g.38226 Transcript_20313/m.38226 type:complete len:87 (+) Transcript_20313:51-311(+)